MENRLARLIRSLPLLVALPASAEGAQGLDIADMSIEDLANIQITSVSKKPERLAAAAASVFVITPEDIRRSGATSIPEVLRMAPNLQVARINNTTYAISARGLNGSNNTGPNKLLVMIDGRSVYLPLFSGVLWEVQDVLLEDVARIEVISGPGGTLWGVNAVNGVINITTRKATDSQGNLLSVAGGNRGTYTGFRHGGGSADTAWRVYGKYQDLPHTELESGLRVNDARHLAQLGFRADFDRGANQFAIHGNAYRGRSEQPRPGAISAGTNVPLGPITSTAANLTAHWTRALDGGGQVSLQGYLDHTKREVVPTYTQSLQIADVQFQHSLPAIGAHSFVWGANYRYSWDDVTNGQVAAFLPAKTNQTWASLFAQDEIKLSEQLRMTLGARIERNDYTGNEFLPTVRLAWSPSSTHSLWTGLSRTVRAPSRVDADIFIPARAPFLLNGGPTIRSEVAKVFELGYRGQPMENLSYSVTAFYNDYDHMRTQEVLSLSPVFVVFANQMEGKARGIEMWGNYQANSRWRLSAGLLALHQRFTLKPGSNDAGATASAGRDPSHTAQLRSSFSLAADKDFDIMLRKVGALSQHAVPGYFAVDARLAWRPRRDVELSLVGQNLNGSHPEYGPLATRTDIPRSIGVKLVWQN